MQKYACVKTEHDIVVGIETRLRAGSFRARIPVRARDFFPFPKREDQRWAATQPRIPGTLGLFPGVQAAGM
jgi:hypothetical protein